MKHFSQYILEQNLTLQYHDELNSKLWKGNKLKPIVRKKMLEIGKAWAEFANIPTKAITDITLVGGNANYNYTAYSDVDIHIIVDRKELPDCPEVLEDYFQDKKQLWSLTHNVKIYGHDVELYAQDKEAKTPKDQGAYSLVKNKWLVKPKQKNIEVDDPHIEKKVKEISHKINNLISSNASDESFKTLKEKMKNMRTAGLKKAGEFSFENMVFKELRNTGLFDKMNDYIRTRQDKKLTL